MQQNSTLNPSVADLARAVNCFDEHSFAALAGVKVSTLDAWRKRGKGPEYALLGCNYLYPIEAVQKHISSCVRRRTKIAPQRVLM